MQVSLKGLTEGYLSLVTRYHHYDGDLRFYITEHFVRGQKPTYEFEHDGHHSKIKYFFTIR